MNVQLERRSVSSCCAASPERIDLSWLRYNPGQLFNIPNLQRDRQQMLDNQPVVSCEDTCWKAERMGSPSRRTKMMSDARTHSDIVSTPIELNITLGSDCNLTCSYCTKQYSTAWLRDINANGPYLDEPRFQINNIDRIVLKLGQNAIKSSDSYQLIIDEICNIHNIDSVNQIVITGGEPFLYNGLEKLVTVFSKPVNIFTGLGVDSNRLKRILNALPDTVTFSISAENVGKLYEFNRYGNTWDNFLKNVELIQKKFSYRFCSVISNLTIHGLEQFRTQVGTDQDTINLCTDPNYLSASVLDPESKILYQSTMPDLLDITLAESTMEQKQKLRKYLYRFAEIRNLDLQIFPKHFIDWINE
jgi:organic radical activating enzyme